MRVRIGGLLALAITLLVASPLHADDWELLGSRQVNFAVDRDVIPVTAREGVFRAIKLEVEDGNLEMYDITVVFGNGEVFSPETRLVFRENSRSRTIDLPGNRRVITRVEFFYRSRARRGKATVRLYGKGAEAAERADRPGSVAPPAALADVAGWTRLGTRAVNFRAERDRIEAVGDGPFRRIMFVVEGGDLEMYDVRVRFRNGEVFSPDTRLVFNSESRSRAIDLPGDRRNISFVEFTYRSLRGGGEGRAAITLYGR